MKTSKKPKGIALIQILLLTAIFSVLALYFTQTSQQQVGLAIYADTQAKLLIDVHSVKNQLLFELITSSKAMNQTIETNSQSAGKWNFHGQPFWISDTIQAQMQDQAGLLSAHYLNTRMLTQVLQANLDEPSSVGPITASVLDWQDTDNLTSNFTDEKSQLGLVIRDAKVPDISDFIHIPIIDETVLSLLQKTTTLQFVGIFNPLTAPNEVLKGLLRDDAYQQITQLREKGRVAPDIFSNITGIIEDEYTWFTPSNFLKLTLISEVDNVKVEKSWVFSLKPYATLSSPINYLEIRG